MRTNVSNLSEEVLPLSNLARAFCTGLCHPLPVERLEQIVHRIHFKRLHRVLIEGRGKDNLGQRDLLVQQFLDHAETIESRHLHVEKNQVGIVFADEIDGFDAVLALGDDVDIADIFQQKGEFIAGELLIVHD